MSDVKQVKVDNWGIYFLQRLKNFFNRTDYCDLTLQFQDNAQLKVHRLVLSACTEYFELLERTCEMYEDCLVMPDDLQADVVVPIVNFMYTGHLEFRMDLLERLYQTSQILNMPVLSKLLESHRQAIKSSRSTHSYNAAKRYSKPIEPSKVLKTNSNTKRSYSKAFESNSVGYRDKKVYQSIKMRDNSNSSLSYKSPSPVAMESLNTSKKSKLGDPRPTRYELPEELDTDNVFDNSFCNISYACKPLMIHPDVKHYSSKHSGLLNEASSSKKILPGMSTLDIVECKRIVKEDNIFDDSMPDHSMNDDIDIFKGYNDSPKDSNQLFDQILDDGPKVTLETRDGKVPSNLDHAKIISEVLKKYPHLVKSNKNIKLKIVNPCKGKKLQKMSPTYVEEKPLKVKTEEPDFTYETDVIDSQQAAKLIAMGAENTKGPWICLICGTPGKALHFTSYYKFRRHLVEVHNEKPVSNICEYCGLRSLKRNYLLHHLYSQHNVPPPPQYHFPKCDTCNYIALTEGFLVKHKLTHKKNKNFRCNICPAQFSETKELLQHIQVTGHKYSAERKTNLQCIYCLKTFLRHGNLYAHLKTNHKKDAKNDGIIDDSDDEKQEEIPRTKVHNRDGKYHHIKFEPSTSYDIYNENIYEEVDVQYQIQEGQDGDIHLTPRKQVTVITNQQLNSLPKTPKQKILNSGFDSPKSVQKPKPVKKPIIESSSFLEDINIPSPSTPNNHNEDEIVLIDNVEYIMRDNQLIPKQPKAGSSEYIITDMMEEASLQAVQPTTSIEYSSVHNTNIVQDTQSAVLMKKATNINQPIQIVVSNEEEYKALMSANHPILFNNGDPNKTLTVLAAPHNAAMETATIDLNNTQGNDVMIIPEDFPLNVTEAVSTDNPNIVVVYSHPVDDQNKQFQILTTGGIGSQFVQSSTIITQNYETVTTTAPVISGHVLEPQPDSTWQDTIQSENAEELPISQQSELQDVNEAEIKRIKNKAITSNNETTTDENLDDLPEVHLTAENHLVPQDQLTSENHLATADQLTSEQSSPEDQLTSEQHLVIAEQLTSEQHLNNADQLTSEQHLVTADKLSSEQDLATADQLTSEHHLVTQHQLTPAFNLASELQTLAPQEELGNDESNVSCTANVAEETAPNLETVQEIAEISHKIPESQMQSVIMGAGLAEQENPAIVEPMDISKVNEDVPEVIGDNANTVTVIEETFENESNVQQTVAEDTNIQPQEVQTLVTEVDSSATINTMTITPISAITETDDLKNTLESEELPQSQAYDEIVEIKRSLEEDPQTSTRPDDKIQNLTSEWSEDEYDVAEDTPATVEVIPRSEEVVTSAEPNRFEETIENIQQEVLSHVITDTNLAASIVPVPEIESENSTLEDETPSPPKPTVPPAVVTPIASDPQTQEKISSLLNDWEDNDSQGENISEDLTVENKDTAEANIAVIPKPDIKSLVSDWDDEEETKEQ